MMPDAGDTLSVAIATYNGEKYLREQLDSIARQTILPCEVVITDDSPTDGTRRLAEQWAKAAPFPVHVHANPERLGYVDNFLRAASLCTGRWIAFCDQDDVWMPDKVERCLSMLRENKALMLVHASQVVDSSGQPAEGREPVIERTEVLEPLTVDPWWCPPGFAMIFAADLLRRFDASIRPGSQIADGQLPHDHWVYFLAQVVGRIALLNVPLAKYRRHAGNVTDGLPPPTDLKTSFQTSSGAGIEIYRGKAALTHTYVDYWRGQAERLKGKTDTESVAFGPESLSVAELRRRCESASEFYAAIERRLIGRAQMYDTSAGGPARLKALIRQVASGAYGGRRGGGLGVKSLAKDAYTVTRALLGRSRAAEPMTPS